jgi:hypothetical protein
MSAAVEGSLSSAMACRKSMSFGEAAARAASITVRAWRRCAASNGMPDFDFGECSAVVFGFPPQEVADELDQEGVASSGLGGTPDQVGGEADARSGEGRCIGILNFPDGRGVQVDLVCPAEKGRHTLIKEVRHRGRQTGEDQADGEPVLDEMLHAGGQLRQFIAVRGMDLINRDDQTGLALVQQSQEVLSEGPLCDRPFGRKLGGDTESRSGNGRDTAGLRTCAELFSELPHGFPDVSHEALGRCLGNDRPALFPGQIMGRADHDGLADAARSRENGQQARGPGPQPQSILKFVQHAVAPEYFRGE